MAKECHCLQAIPAEIKEKGYFAGLKRGSLPLHLAEVFKPSYCCS